MSRKEMAIDHALVGFGRAHNELVVLLEALAGGNGPYGNSKVIFDAVTHKDALPARYGDLEIEQVRLAVDDLERADADSRKDAERDLLEKRREVLTPYDDGIFQFISDLRLIARNIYDDVQRLSRLHQVDGLEVAYHLLLSQLFPNRHTSKPMYRAAVSAITGYNMSWIPPDGYLESVRASIEEKLGDLGFAEGSFRERVAAFRANQPVLSEAEYVARYAALTEEFVAYIKATVPGFPREAGVNVVDLKDRPGVAGSFDYGRGGDFRGETSVRPASDKTLPFLLQTVAHEIGGHFRLAVQWDLYSRETGDPYGSLQTMCSNMTVVNEGVAEQGALFYDGVIARHVDPKVMAIENDLYFLNRVLLGHQVARRFTGQEQSEAEIVEQCLAYGLFPSTAAIRANALADQSQAWEFRGMTYIGPSYYPGMRTVRDLITFGRDEAESKREILRVVREPISIAALHLAMFQD